jgi:hypothetical protein
MNNGLLYIYPVGEPERLAERRGLAESLGFKVEPLTDEYFIYPEVEQRIIDGLTPDRCAGVWVDVHTSDIGDRTSRVIMAAHNAGINLLGHQDPSMDIKRNLRTFIGIPERNQ